MPDRILVVVWVAVAYDVILHSLSLLHLWPLVPFPLATPVSVFGYQNWWTAYWATILGLVTYRVAESE